MSEEQQKEKGRSGFIRNDPTLLITQEYEPMLQVIAYCASPDP